MSRAAVLYLVVFGSPSSFAALYSLLLLMAIIDDVDVSGDCACVCLLFCLPQTASICIHRVEVPMSTLVYCVVTDMVLCSLVLCAYGPLFGCCCFSRLWLTGRRCCSFEMGTGRFF